MTKITGEFTIGQKIKLASLAAHVEEYLEERDPRARAFDESAMRTLLAEPDVREILDNPDNGALLPAKR